MRGGKIRCLFRPAVKLVVLHVRVGEVDLVGAVALGVVERAVDLVAVDRDGTEDELGVADDLHGVLVGGGVLLLGQLLEGPGEGGAGDADAGADGLALGAVLGGESEAVQGLVDGDGRLALGAVGGCLGVRVGVQDRVGDRVGQRAGPEAVVDELRVEQGLAALVAVEVELRLGALGTLVGGGLTLGGGAGGLVGGDGDGSGATVGSTCLGGGLLRTLPGTTGLVVRRGVDALGEALALGGLAHDVSSLCRGSYSVNCNVEHNSILLYICQ